MSNFYWQGHTPKKTTIKSFSRDLHSIKRAASPGQTAASAGDSPCIGAPAGTVLQVFPAPGIQSFQVGAYDAGTGSFTGAPREYDEKSRRPFAAGWLAATGAHTYLAVSPAKDEACRVVFSPERDLIVSTVVLQLLEPEGLA